MTRVEDRTPLVPVVLDPRQPFYTSIGGYDFSSYEGLHEWLDHANEVIDRVSRYYGKYMVEDYRENGGHLPPDPDGMDYVESAELSVDYLLVHMEAAQLETVYNEIGDPIYGQVLQSVIKNLKGYGCTTDFQVPTTSWRNVNSRGFVKGSWTFPEFDAYEGSYLKTANLDFSSLDHKWHLYGLTNSFGTELEIPKLQEVGPDTDPLITRFLDHGIVPHPPVQLEAEKYRYVLDEFINNSFEESADFGLET